MAGRRLSLPLMALIVCGLALGVWLVRLGYVAPRADQRAAWRVIDDGAGSAHVDGNQLTLQPAPAIDAAQARSATAVLDSPPLNDYSYALELLTQPLPDNAAPPLVQLLIRYRQPSTGYYLSHSAAGLELGKVDGTRQLVLARSAAPAAAPTTTPQEYRVDADGSTVRVFVDGQLWISYDDPQPILTGGAGISVQGVQATVTDASVTALRPGATPADAGAGLARVSLTRPQAPLLATPLPTLTATAVPAGPAASPAGAPQGLEGLVGWGTDASGELGGSAAVPRLAPARIPGPDSATALATGHQHSLAVDAAGHVWAWGTNTSGQLGDGTTQDHGTPLLVPSLEGVTSVAAGDDHSLALLADGSVWAWGANAAGQLGDGTTADRTTPVAVHELDGVRAIAGGHAFSLALKTDGTVWAWGANEAGQLGNGSTVGSPLPVRVRDLDHVEAITAGAFYSLARTSNGSVWAWGADEYGQLGQGAPSPGRNAPVPVAGLGRITTIAAGGYHALAVDTSGTAWAWGANWFGELGDSSSEMCLHDGQPQPCSSVPRPVRGLDRPLAKLAAGEFHSLALASDGSVWAWGLNADGELGDGTHDTSSAPVRVSGLGAESAIAAGGRHSLAASPVRSVPAMPPR